METVVLLCMVQYGRAETMAALSQEAEYELVWRAELRSAAGLGSGVAPVAFAAPQNWYCTAEPDPFPISAETL